ncbi:MAG: hypothetical protein DDT19_00200 [Syntrophomonadaceae bacterium]|nr:hypothetical protein [Bacillota bacterium]
MGICPPHGFVVSFINQYENGRRYWYEIQGLLKVNAAVFSVLFVLILVACGHIQLIAPYDERIENGVTELQKNTTAFFVKIERQGGSDKDDYKKAFLMIKEKYSIS